jgi:hypothetical protein
MTEVWKALIPIKDCPDTHPVEFPEGAELLDAAVQGENFAIWALVSTRKPPTAYRISVVFTGEPMWSGIPRKHLATITHHELVYHIFQEYA